MLEQLKNFLNSTDALTDTVEILSEMANDDIDPIMEKIMLESYAPKSASDRILQEATGDEEIDDYLRDDILDKVQIPKEEENKIEKLLSNIPDDGFDTGTASKDDPVSDKEMSSYGKSPMDPTLEELIDDDFDLDGMV